MIKAILFFVLGFIAGISGLVPLPSWRQAGASSNEVQYTSALEDLQKDTTFDITAYPAIKNDASLSIITISESVNDELFVYVYQPSSKYQASSLMMSTNENNIDTYQNYTLSYLSGEGVFQKYKVEDFNLPDKEDRVYEISSILRPFEEGIDTPAAEGQTISEVPYAVGKRFTINADGMSATDIELITVTDKYVGFSRYKEGYNYISASDIHFVAFSTDKKIDDLLEADIYYQQQHYSYAYHTNGQGGVFVDKENYGSIEDKYAKLKKGDEFVWYETGGFWGTETTETTFPVILSSKDFIESEEFSNTYNAGIFNLTGFNSISAKEKDALSSKSWVVRFAQTSYEENFHFGKDVSRCDGEWDIVSNVSILRLTFETGGEIFNLGVVDNKQTGSQTPLKKGCQVADWKNSIVIAIFIAFAVVGLISIWRKKDERNK